MPTSLRAVLAPMAPDMDSHRADEARFWGYMITSRKTATPVFEQLLFAIARYIVSHLPFEWSALAIDLQVEHRNCTMG